MSQKYINLSSLFTDIADAIREKKGTNESIIADDFPDEISSIESGGGIINFEQKFIKRAIQLSIYENSRVTTIGDGAFYNYSSLTSVSFPQATTIGNSAFQRCSKLTSVNFPQATTIKDNAFYYCSSLASLSFPQVVTIGNSAFQYCSQLTSISFPQATSIGSYTFYYCASLTSVSFPKTILISNYAFYVCSSLTLVNFPLVTTIGYNAFYRCLALISVSFPQVITIGNNAFQSCSKLTSVNFPQATTIGSYAFQYCSKLTSVILGGQQSQKGTIYPNAFSKCYNLTDLHLQGSYLYSLSKSNAFNSTPIGGYSTSAGKYGSIYVPASLYSQYISATNWTYFSSRFVSVSQSSGGNNNDCGFTVNGNTLTITDESKLDDGLLNTDDYLVVGVGLDENGYTELYQLIENISSEQGGDLSIDFRIFNDELENVGIFNEGLSICLIDNNNTYHCLLDESLFGDVVFATLISDQGTSIYIPVIHKNNISDSLTFQIKNDLDFYMVCYEAYEYYQLADFALVDYFGAAFFHDWQHDYSIEAIEPITYDMFSYQ